MTDSSNTTETSTSTATTEALVRAEEITVRFQDQVILQDICLAIPRGQTLAIIGESGCGKTVLLKTLVGLVRPTSGRVFFDDDCLNDLDAKQITEARKRLGFVFQNAALFDSMTVFQNVAFPLHHHRLCAPSQMRTEVMKRLHQVGLPGTVAEKRPAEISGGMRKRVGLARALIMEPELLVYDEPTTGLDPIMSDVINELILEVRRQFPVTSVIVTHDMHTARKVADRVLMLYPRHRLQAHESQVLFDGPPSALEHAEDRRVRQFVRGEAGERLTELLSQQEVTIGDD